MRSALDSTEAGIIRPILVGPEAKIRSTAERHGLHIAMIEIVDAPHSDAGAAKAIELSHAAKARC